MKFSFSIYHINIILIFSLFILIPVKTQAETVYITDSLLVGLHQEKSIDSAILKLLPTGTALKVIKRDDEFVHVRDPMGISGWVSNSYLISNDPDINASLDTDIAQSKIRKLEAELQNIRMQQSGSDQNKDHEPMTSPDALIKLKIENENLKQKIKSDKLKSGELQARLAELRNKISQDGSNDQFTDKIRLLTEKNAIMENEIKQLKNSKIKNLVTDTTSEPGPVVSAGIALLIGLLTGIILMDWRARRRLGGLRF